MRRHGRLDDPHALLEHDDFLRALARGLVVDEARADDVVQQAWLAAVKRGPDRPESLRAWLATAVRRLASKLRRGESRRGRHEQAAARVEAVPSVAEIVAREQARRRVVEAVLELDEPGRSTLLLRYFERLPPRAIARRMDVPVETVRTRIKRSLERLRARLDADFGGERAAWAVALLPFAKAAPVSTVASVVGGAGALVATLSGGVLLMSAKAKLVVAGAAIVLGLAVTLFVASHQLGPASRRVEGLAVSDRTAAPVSAGARTAESAKREAEAASTPPETATSASASGAVAKGGLTVHVFWDADRGKAAGVGVTLIPSDNQNPLADSREATTDDEGMCSFAAIAAGDWMVVGDRGGRTPAKVEAGVTHDVELRIGKGEELAGVVVDSHGIGVSDAEVWLSGDSSSTGRIVARCDADGRFAIRSVTPPQVMGARAAGFAPSALQSFNWGARGLTKLRLVLGPRGGSLSGRIVRIVGGERIAVAGALVQLGDESLLTQVSTHGDVGPMALVLRQRSDPDGRFRFEGTMTGEVPLIVRGAELAPWRGRVELKAGASADVAVELLTGATLEGRVTRADGSAVAKADVRVGSGDSLGASKTLTSGEGLFRFEHLAPGPIDAVVASDSDGFARASLVTNDGATLRWDAELTAGPSIRGRVVDQEEHPIAGCEIRGMSPGDTPGDWTMRTAKTADDGRFEVKNCVRRPFQLEVRPRATGYTGSQFAQDVVPGGDEIVFHVSHAQPATAWVTGTVTDSEGSPIGDANIFAFPRVSAGIVAMAFATDASGSFKAGPLAPGAYSVSVRKEGYPDLSTASFELAADEHRELGSLRMPRGGTLRVRFVRADRRKIETFDATAWSTATGAAYACDVEGDSTRLSLAAGSYELRTLGGGCMPTRTKFEIAEGEEHELAVELQPASDAVLILSGLDAVIASLHSNTPYAFTRVVDARGNTLDECGLPAFPGHRAEWRIALSPGDYRVEVRAGNRVVGRAGFTVPSDRVAEEFDLTVR